MGLDLEKIFRVEKTKFASTFDPLFMSLITINKIPSNHKRKKSFFKQEPMLQNFRNAVMKKTEINVTALSEFF